MFHLASVQTIRIARKPWVRVHQNPGYQPDQSTHSPTDLLSADTMNCCC
jgi:hypothetical protein